MGKGLRVTGQVYRENYLSKVTMGDDMILFRPWMDLWFHSL